MTREVPIGPAVELLDRGDQLFAQRKYVEARRTYAQAVNAGGPNHAYVEACAQVARMDSLQGQMREGEPWLRMGLSRASAAEPLGWSRIQLVLGIFERESGDRATATQRFKDLYAYDLKHGLYERAIDAAHHVVLASEDPGEQLLWSRKGIEAAEEGGLQGWLAVLWNNMGASLEDQGRWPDALIAYEEARTYHYAVGSDHAKLVADWAVARAMRHVDRLDEAREISERTAEWARLRYDDEPSAERAEWVGYTLWELAELDALDGEMELAVDQLREARARLIEAGIETWGDFGTKELMKLDLRLGELTGK